MKNFPNDLFFIFNKWQKAISVEIYNLTLFQIYQNWAHKSISRYLKDNNNFEMILSFSVFAVAFSQMIWFRYQEKSFSFFYKNTFPGVGLPCQNLSWDTFSTIFMDNISQHKKLQLKKVDIYPESIFLSPNSNKYFNQKLLDIGILPVKKKLYPKALLSSEIAKDHNKIITLPNCQDSKKYTFSEKKYTKPTTIGSTRSSLFSYRFQSKILFFKDEFPSKIASNFSELVSQETTNLETLLETGFDQGKNIIFFKKSMQPALLVSPNVKPMLEQTSTVFDSIKPQKNSVLSKKVNFFNQGLLKINRLNGNSNQNVDSINLETIDSNKEKKFYWKAFFSKKNLLIRKEINNSQLTKKIYEGLSSTLSHKLNETDTKKDFFVKQITDFSHQSSINPFFSLENIFQIENENEQNSTIQPKLEENFFVNICCCEILESFFPLNVQKPLLWLGPRVQSGFLYPDNSSIRSLIDQGTYQKNPVIKFYKKIFTSKQKENSYGQVSNISLYSSEVLKKYYQNHILNTNFQRGKFYCTKSKVGTVKLPLTNIQMLPIEVFFHPNISSSQITNTLEVLNSRNQNLKKDGFQKQLFGFKYKPISLVFENQDFYKGPGLVKTKVTFDINLSNKHKVMKWIKNYYSQKNFLTDRKDNFFGCLPKFLQEKKQGTEIVEKANFDKKKQIIQKIIPASSFNSLSSEKFEEIRNNLLAPKGPKSENLTVIADSRLNVSESFEKNYVLEFSRRLPVILCNENWQIPSIQKEEWEYIVQKANMLGNFVETKLNETFTLEKKVSSSDDFSKKDYVEQDFRTEKIELSIPLIRIALPTSVSNLEKEISLKQPWPLTFAEYKPNGIQSFFKDFFNSTQITYNSVPWSRAQWTPNNVSKRCFGGIYKREPSIFSSLSQKSFHTISEPFTLNSWMILNQFCFLLFCLKVCQSSFQEYGKEIIIFLLEVLESLGVIDDELKEDLQVKKSGTGFRVFKEITNRFKDVAGIDTILPDLAEIVWFLRNSGRSLKIGKVIPKGILFVGEPGTGKTFLANAIAGEAEVPVLVQSGSTLSVPNKPGKGAELLKNLFSQARELAPCIIFIDEIDTLGAKRQHVTQNPLGEDTLFETFGTQNVMDKTSRFFQTDNKAKLDNQFGKEEAEKKESTSYSNSENLPEKGDQLNILTQFLVEMDGIESRQGIIVIGATNRPGVLDPAFTRPGRFDQIIQLEFPTKQKRIEILKLYSKNLGIDFNLSWNYLGNRTYGCSAADLSAAMNESSIQAILKDTTHTVETIEQGLDFIQNSTRQKSSFFILKKGTINQYSSHDPFFFKRLAYSQAGKVTLFTLLPKHPFPIFLNLWTPLYSTNLRKSDSILKSFSTRFELENKLVGLYAGKACELLVLFKNSGSIFYNFIVTNKSWDTKESTRTVNLSLVNKVECSQNLTCFNFPNSMVTLWESDLNREDLRQGNLLARSMIDRWFFYSKKLSFQKWNSILTNQNQDVFVQSQDMRDISFFKNLTSRTEIEPQIEHSEKNWQKISLRAWWQNNVAQQTGLSRSKHIFLADWYRIYLPDPEQNIRNEEFIPSDEYYHNGDRSLNLLQYSKKSSIYWNDLYKNNHDFLYQSLILSSFNKAFILLDQNREVVDFFADFLLRYETIREKQISSFFLNFTTSNE